MPQLSHVGTALLLRTSGQFDLAAEDLFEIKRVSKPPSKMPTSTMVMNGNEGAGADVISERP